MKWSFTSAQGKDSNRLTQTGCLWEGGIGHLAWDRTDVHLTVNVTKGTAVITYIKKIWNWYLGAMGNHKSYKTFFFFSTQLLKFPFQTKLYIVSEIGSLSRVGYPRTSTTFFSENVTVSILESFLRCFVTQKHITSHTLSHSSIFRRKTSFGRRT